MCAKILAELEQVIVGKRDAVALVLLIGAFYVIPIGHESGLRAFVRLGLDIAIVGAVFAWQIRRISVAALNPQGMVRWYFTRNPSQTMDQTQQLIRNGGRRMPPF